jgi:hypothetical protein
VGGDTIVATGRGEVVLGVPDRPDFIIALGSGDRIVGAGKDSELGALGEKDTIVARKGHERIVGGPHGTIIASGAGHDLLIETHPDATIVLKSPDDVAIVSGHHDRVICSGDSVHDTIYVNHSDTVSKTCRKHHDPVLPVNHAVAAAARAAGLPVAHAAAVTGDGSNSNPYVAPCDLGIYAGFECAVSSFPARTLTGLWANEYVPAYKCPSDHPWLDARKDYAPSGTSLPVGVQVEGLGSIGVSITGHSTATSPYGDVAAGTLTGYPNSSATNWTIGSASYRVILHCTNAKAYVYR